MKTDNKKTSGVTLVEVMVTVAIIGVVFFMSSAAMKLLNGFSRVPAAFQTQRDVEVTLYQIVREVREASKIVNISTMTPPGFGFQLSVYNLSSGYDIARYAGVKTFPLQTVVYQFQTDNKGTYLDRKLMTQGATPVVLNEKKLLRNLLVPEDDPATPYPDCIFVPVPFEDIYNAHPIFDTVGITFRVHPKGIDTPERVYSAQSMVRSGGS